MNAEDSQTFENILKRQLRELLQQAGATVAGLLDQTDQEPDPLDRASLELERNYKLRIRDRESRLIKKIIQSLKDIEDNTYGICQMCGDDISIARLKARPVARHCIACKRKMEQLERVAGF